MRQEPAFGRISIFLWSTALEGGGGGALRAISIPRLKLASLVLGALMVLDGFLAQLHYNWYHLVAVKHMHLILLLLLLVLKVWVSCPMLPILLCVHLIHSFIHSVAADGRRDYPRPQ